MHRFHPPYRRPVRGWRLPVTMLVLLAALWTVAGLAHPNAALAQVSNGEIPRLQDQITDLTQRQVLAGGRAQVDAALNDLPGITSKAVIAMAVATTTAQPMPLYQSQEMSVKFAVQRITASPTSMPVKVAVPRTFGKAKASTKQPSSEP